MSTHNFAFRLLYTWRRHTHLILHCMQHSDGVHLICTNSTRLLFSFAFSFLYSCYFTHSVRNVPEECSNPVCDNDATLCPGEIICKPQPPGFFESIELACVVVFTVEYIARMATCWTVPKRFAESFIIMYYMRTPKLCVCPAYLHAYMHPYMYRYMRTCVHK